MQRIKNFITSKVSLQKQVLGLQRRLDDLSAENLELQNKHRQELNASLEMLRQEQLQNSDPRYQELYDSIENHHQEQLQHIGDLRQEINHLAEALRQEQIQYTNMLRQDINQLAEMLRQEQLQYINSLRQELMNSIEMLRQEDLNIDINTTALLTQNTEKKINDAALKIVESLLQTRWMLAKKEFVHHVPPKKNALPPQKVESFDLYLDKFKHLHPHLFELWSSVNLDLTVKEFQDHPERSCAVEARLNARFFRGFIAPYLSGKILDVGCGPYALPSYLQEYPLQSISGIDPLEPFESHPFEFVRGFAEFLPWDDSTFDVVIAATSLDHVISLDLALSEIRRVLKPGGFLITWDWFGEDTAPYNPTEQSPQLIDQYHFFNFSEKWFEELMTPHFVIIEKLQLFGDWVHDYFYSLQLNEK